MTTTHLDLFTGLGVFTLAFQAAGFRTIGHVEIDQNCQQLLSAKFPNIPKHTDIKDVNPDQLECPTVVSFGSPCTDLSVAGQRAGLDSARSGLFYEATRIIRKLVPRGLELALWENVEGAFSSSGGRDFARVLAELADCGALDIGWCVLDGQFWGPPQRRRRIFLVADFRAERASQILSLPEGLCGHPAPSRQAGQRVAPTVVALLSETTSKTNFEMKTDEANGSQHTKSYAEFLNSKSQISGQFGFKAIWLPDFLFDFQKYLAEKSITRGREAIFADCGLGKTPMQLVWSENVVRHSNGRVLIAAPLAVGAQTVGEGEKFGVQLHQSRDGSYPSNAKLIVTNYEQLQKFDPNDFVGMACDESSCLKHFSGVTQKQVTRFMSKLKYRSLWTATAAPNDYTELGTSSEALGELGYSDMLTRFFRQTDKKRCRIDDVKLSRDARTGNHYARLAYRVSQQIGQWRMKGHAEEAFWRWVCSWAIACRRPSDLGFNDTDFILPPLNETHHVIEPKNPANGMLFTLPAFGLSEEREERRRTLHERCEFAAKLVDNAEPAVIWCHYNTEGDLLEKLIPNSIQVAGSDKEQKKEEAAIAFKTGQKRVLISKARIFGFGLNFQHCARVVTFCSHSYEQYYQTIRRCWRFGQTKPVTVDVISTTGEQYVADNMQRKAAAAEQMFERLLAMMHRATSLETKQYSTQPQIPNWL